MRVLTALLLGLLVAGCTTAHPPLQSASTRSPSPAASPPTSPSPTPTASPAPKTCRVGARLAPGAVVSVIGDSYTTGGGVNSWPKQLARRARLTAFLDAADGSGYMIGGFTGHDFSGPRFPDQVAKLRPQRPDLVIIMGSRNDITHTDPPYPSVVLKTLQAIRAAVPTAPLLVVGSFWPDAHASVSMLYVHQVLREATAMIPCASFLDPVEEGWFDRPAGYFGSDGEHPNAAGIDRVADLYVRDLRRLGYL